MHYANQEFPDVQAGFRKGRGTRDQIANIRWIIEKAREFQKNIYLCFINYSKAFDCVDHNNLWKALRDGTTRASYLSPEKPVCRSRSKFVPCRNNQGFPGGTRGKEPAYQLWRHKRHGFHPWVRKIPWRRVWQPTPVFLPGKSPWMKEPGRLQSVGSQRVRHDWSNSAAAAEWNN